MLRVATGPSLVAASLATAWLVLAACADRNTPVSSRARADAGAPPSSAQGVKGRVVSTAGPAVVGALVQPSSLDGHAVPEMAVVTDDDGRYEWTLRPGRYELSVSAEGFETATARAAVTAGQQTTLDFTLTPVR